MALAVGIYMPVEKSAGAIIFTQHHFPDKTTKRGKHTQNGAGFRKEKGEVFYLLIQYGLGHWGFPRGLIEKGENLEEAAKREIEEETGINDLEFLSGFKETIRYFYKFEEKNILKFATYFLAETKQKEVKLSFEHKDFAWLLFEEAKERLTFKNSKQVLEKAHEHLIEHITHNT